MNQHSSRPCFTLHGASRSPHTTCRPPSTVGLRPARLTRLQVSPHPPLNTLERHASRHSNLWNEVSFSQLTGSEVPEPLVLRGRVFTTADISTIKRVVNQATTRTSASIEICTLLDWRQPNGWLKERACRDVLLNLERKGIVTLPSRQSYPNNSRSSPRREVGEYVDTSPTDSLPFGSLDLHQVKGTSDEWLWNELVRAYHYLGHSVSVGRTLKYLAECEGRVIAAMAVNDPAWAVKCRDQAISSSGTDSRLRVINNSRFLVLPWVDVRNLASKLLSLLCRRVANDWQDYYALRPRFIETFVDSGRYKGICYRAANWVEIGMTSGYMKHGSSHSNSQLPKRVFIYALDRQSRRLLRNQ